jgi:hypothetical protein|tara:strand:+ start:1655 stop:2074 length:420 start_codon:yes stop_codon:yes gene_type:complete
MATNFTKSYRANVGINHTPAYQVSGRPFASAGTDAQNATKVDFPFVTRWVQVINTSDHDVRVGFSEIGVSGSNYFTLQSSGSVRGNSSTDRLELKITQLWLYSPTKSTSIDVVAGLTTVPVSRASSSFGPSFSGSTGVG